MKTRQKCKCDICDKEMYKYNLKRHLGIHNKDTPSPLIRTKKCDICGKCFGNKSNLTIHMNVHKGEKSFQCELCRKCFTKKAYLKVHLNRHTNVRPFECNVCGSKFIVKGSLLNHMERHDKNQTNSYKCKIYREL